MVHVQTEQKIQPPAPKKEPVYTCTAVTCHPNVIPNRIPTPADALRQFKALKAACDPEDLLQTDLYRRVVRPALAMA